MKEAIIKLIEKWACKHKWKLEIERGVKDYETERQAYTSYTYVCQECGKFKRWRSS